MKTFVLALALISTIVTVADAQVRCRPTCTPYGCYPICQ